MTEHLTRTHEESAEAHGRNVLVVSCTCGWRRLATHQEQADYIALLHRRGEEVPITKL